MIAGILGGIAAGPQVRIARRYGAIVFAVLLFLLTIRRAASSADPAADRPASHAQKLRHGRRTR